MPGSPRELSRSPRELPRSPQEQRGKVRTPLPPPPSLGRPRPEAGALQPPAAEGPRAARTRPQRPTPFRKGRPQWPHRLPAERGRPQPPQPRRRGASGLRRRSSVQRVPHSRASSLRPHRSVPPHRPRKTCAYAYACAYASACRPRPERQRAPRPLRPPPLGPLPRTQLPQECLCRTLERVHRFPVPHRRMLPSPVQPQWACQYPRERLELLAPQPGRETHRLRRPCRQEPRARRERGRPVVAQRHRYRPGRWGSPVPRRWSRSALTRRTPQEA